MGVQRIAALVLSSLSVCASCNAQDATTKAGDASNDAAAATAAGDVVAAMSGSLWDVLQDKRGNYWFASTAQGVYRDDGATVVQFTTKHGLAGDRVRGIYDDAAGNLYFSTDKGLSKFDGKTFTTLSIPTTPSPMTEWKLQKGDVWFPCGQDTGAVLRYDGRTVHRLVFPRTDAGDAATLPRDKYPNAKYSPYDVYTIYEDSEGNMWFGTACLGACRFDGKSFVWISESELEYSAMLEPDQSFGVRSILEDENGLFLFSNVRNRFRVYPPVAAPRENGPSGFGKEAGIDGSGLPTGYEFDLFQTGAKGDDGHLWMTTWKAGVVRYDGKVLSHYPVMKGDRPAAIGHIYKDRRGGLWLTTQDAGLYKFDGEAFEPFKP